MESAFLTIKEAAQFIDKAEVTIRRLLKRLLKNRTSETDRCIVESTEQGKRLYRIEPRFLVTHANLNKGTRQRLLDQLDQMTIHLHDDQGLLNQKSSPSPQTPSQMESTTDHLNSHSTSLPNQMNTIVDQVPTQTTGDYASDPPAAQGTDQPDNQLRSQTESDGSKLLNDVVDELRNQMTIKDEQIKEKDKQIERKDTQLEKRDGTIDVLNATIQKLTDGIQQGNFLVASAQERIPLPNDSKRETITPQHEIVETESDSLQESTVEPENELDDKAKPGGKRGFLGRLADKISFSNN